MESAMANVMTAYYNLLSYEYQRIAEDATVTDKLSAYENLMSVASDPYSQWVRVNWLAAQNRYAEAYTIGIQALNALRPLSDCRADWSNYLMLLQTLSTYSANPEFAFSATQQQEWLDMIDESRPSSKGLILQSLLQYGDVELDFDTSYPIDANGLRSMSVANEETTPAWLSIYPNPVDEYFSIRLADAPTSTQARYVLTDVTGRQVLSGGFVSNNQEVLVSSSKLTEGTYLLSIFDGEQLLHAEKLLKE